MTLHFRDAGPNAFSHEFNLGKGFYTVAIHKNDVAIREILPIKYFILEIYRIKNNISEYIYINPFIGDINTIPFTDDIYRFNQILHLGEGVSSSSLEGFLCESYDCFQFVPGRIKGAYDEGLIMEHDIKIPWKSILLEQYDFFDKERWSKMVKFINGKISSERKW